MANPSTEVLTDAVVKAAVRSSKEQLAAHTSHVLTHAEEQLVVIGILAGVKAMAAELTARGAIKEVWG